MIINNKNKIFIEKVKVLHGDKFDFYLPNKNICIEYNGIQHYESVIRFGGEKIFRIQQIKDKIKSDFCNTNDIKLEIIKYSDKLENKLNTLIKL